MSMPKRVRMCEKRGAKHYKGRVLDRDKEWGPVHTCLTPAEYEWERYCDWHRGLFGFIPDRPLDGETGQQYLSQLHDYDGNVEPPSPTAQRRPDGWWECEPPSGLARDVALSSAADDDPYAAAAMQPDERE